MSDQESVEMLYQSLDSRMQAGIDAICREDWNAAQECLGARLDETASLGRRRLNLYLLAFVATSSGHPKVGEMLTELASASPIEPQEPRYLGSGDEASRHRLERDWWAFNHWGTDEGGQGHLCDTHGAAGEIDWPQVLDGCLEGRAGELERKWSRFLDGDSSDRPILWNLVAIGYLEGGDPRTYEEMRDSAPTSSPPVTLPPLLAALLSEAGLLAAMADLEQGVWLSSDRLSLQTFEAPTTAAPVAPGWESDLDILDDPFGQEVEAEETAWSGDPGELEGRFWHELERALVALDTSDLAACKRLLRDLPSSQGEGSSAREFLVALLFAGAAVLEGDHMEAQDSIEQASALLRKGGFRSEDLQRARDLFKAIGAHVLAGKLTLDLLPKLDPWHDFPADFPLQSFSAG